MKFVSPLFGNVEIDYIHDFFVGNINIIRIDGRQPIEVKVFRHNCYLISSYNQLKFKISWGKFLSKMQHSHDINFKRRLFTLVGELNRRDKISEQKALQRFYANEPTSWVGVALPTIVNKPTTLVQLLWRYLFPNWYNKKNAKRFPKLNAEQFVTIQPMDTPTDLTSVLSFQDSGPLAGIYGYQKTKVNDLLEQQAKQIITEYEIARTKFKNRKEVFK